MAMMVNVSVQKLQDYSKLLETILKYNQKFGKQFY